MIEQQEVMGEILPHPFHLYEQGIFSNENPTRRPIDARAHHSQSSVLRANQMKAV